MSKKNPFKSAIASILALSMFVVTVATVSAETALAEELVTSDVTVEADMTVDEELAAVPLVIAAAAGAAVGAFAVGFAVGFVKCLLGRKKAETELALSVDVQEAMLN